MKTVGFVTLVRDVVPVLVLLYMGFLEYSFCYEFCYRTVERRSISISLIGIYNVLLCAVLGTWIWVFVEGPGCMGVRVPPYDLDASYRRGRGVVEVEKEEDGEAADGELENPHDHRPSCSPPPQSHPISPTCLPTSPSPPPTIPPPSIFLCNSQGLPAYCTACQTLKVLRSHHTSSCSRCVPTMDHYCLFLGSAIGQNNYRDFIAFIVSVDCLLLLSVVAILCYIKKHLHPAIIVGLSVNIWLFLMVSNLIGSSLSMIRYNETTIERLAKRDLRRRLRKRKNTDVEVLTTYVNVRHPTLEGIRLVVPLSVKDCPYDKGTFAANFKERMTRCRFCNVEEIMEYEKKQFGADFKRKVYERIAHEQGPVRVFGEALLPAGTTA
ncbi:DEKNAAC105432 [Brettanomyces naardenensis]|uniref:Palmitoyltransferase n=1 Tax=Brettanomyces naardenensis TaxID=13370 RepID=A0A448YTF2_BRENA|nr:DEKNAAC105432 [Brettanomyces naardenensis]